MSASNPNFTPTYPISASYVSLTSNFKETDTKLDFNPPGFVTNTRVVLAGTGLTGGGALASDISLSVVYGTTSGTSAQGNDTRIVNAVQTSRVINTGLGLSGGGSLAGNLTIRLADIPNLRVLANLSGTSAPADAHTVSEILDAAVSNSQGAFLYRNASNWVALAPGSAGQVLKTGGAGANPAWGSPGVLRYDEINPSSGSTYTIGNNKDALLITAGSVIAALTIVMPSAPQDGQPVIISNTSGVTACTIQGNTGQTILGAPATLDANKAVAWVFIAASSTWVRLY